MSREYHATPALAHTIGSGDLAGLACFGRVLGVHVQYEERELFPVAEAILPAAARAEVVTYASVVIEPVT